MSGIDRGTRWFRVESCDDRKFEVVRTCLRANQPGRLIHAQHFNDDNCRVDPLKLFEPASEHISRMIREVYWEGLTRRIDSIGLQNILADQKMEHGDSVRYLYVPANDSVAASYFSSFLEIHKGLNAKTVSLPETITPDFVRGLDHQNGLLVLGLTSDGNGGYSGRPYVVPGGRFNELYGWDSYFIVLGLLADKNVALAKDIVDNLVYEIKHFGKILNGNRTYYLTRSQPPFLTSMLLAVYEQMEKGNPSKEWLGDVLDAAIREYWDVWMNKDHLTKTGLSRYFDTGTGPCPEVEPGHYDAIFRQYAKSYRMDVSSFQQAYTSGIIPVPELDRYFVNDRAMRESGHDTSYRLLGRCADLVTVDLNSLLYKVERDIAAIIQSEFGGSYATSSGLSERSNEWLERARRRQELINKYLWDERTGMYLDYDFVKRKKTGYVSATALCPLWTGLATRHQADLLVKKALPLLETPGGVAATSEKSRGVLTANRTARQWDYPYGWAPHQMIAWNGLQQYGFTSIARRLAYRWLFTITLNAVNYSGVITEKYDVVRRSHEVFVEYGNVGSAVPDYAQTGFGWTNASYQVGLSFLNSELRQDLDELIPPEWIATF